MLIFNIVAIYIKMIETTLNYQKPSNYLESIRFYENQKYMIFFFFETINRNLLVKEGTHVNLNFLLIFLETNENKMKLTEIE
jgi:hypothetical protein